MTRNHTLTPKEQYRLRQAMLVEEYQDEPGGIPHDQLAPAAIQSFFAHFHTTVFENDGQCIVSLVLKYDPAHCLVYSWTLSGQIVNHYIPFASSLSWRNCIKQWLGIQ